jgi:hypothetical protein
MAKSRDLLKRMQQSPFGWGQDDFRRLYRAYGFEVIEGGRHIVVRHPDHPDLNTTVARHQELAPAYARTAARLIEELLRRTAKSESRARGKK